MPDKSFKAHIDNILKLLHEAGGCHGCDDWAKGYDEGINVAFGLIRKYGFENGYHVIIDDII